MSFIDNMKTGIMVNDVLSISTFNLSDIDKASEKGYH